MPRLVDRPDLYSRAQWNRHYLLALRGPVGLDYPVGPANLRGPESPAGPAGPVNQERPVRPAGPEDPADPVAPVGPVPPGSLERPSPPWRIQTV